MFNKRIKKNNNNFTENDFLLNVFEEIFLLLPSCLRSVTLSSTQTHTRTVFNEWWRSWFVYREMCKTVGRQAMVFNWSMNECIMFATISFERQHHLTAYRLHLMHCGWSTSAIAFNHCWSSVCTPQPQLVY